MESADLPAYEALATNLGFDVPPLLQGWIASGLTSYPQNLGTTMSQFLAENPRALTSVWDLEWSTLDHVRETVDDWLTAEHQDGVRFLPFAQSGAGDAYALVAMPDGRTGCGMIWHDDETSEIAHADFASWAAAQLADAMVDLRQLQDVVADGAVASVVRADVASVAPFLTTDAASLLTTWAARDVLTRDVKPAPARAAESVPSLIAHDELTDIDVLVALPEPFEVAVRGAWEF